MITYGQFFKHNFQGCLFVTDQNVGKLYNLHGNDVFVLPNGESAKTLENVGMLCAWFLANKLGKDGHVVAVGGGCVGDTVGFACSVYKRGVKLTHVPTTLVAQVDSSIGGKTAVNLDGVKNAVGSFHRADVFVDTNFLRTLPQQEVQNGLGEVLKYRMLCSEIDDCFVQHGLEKTIPLCVEFKQRVCKKDPYDKSLRQILNAGHTIGHALEILHNIPHGLAVANGLYYETKLALQLGHCWQSFAEKWLEQIANNFAILPLVDGVANLVEQDKKNKLHKIGFVFPTQKGYKKFLISSQKVQQLLHDLA